MCLFYVHSQGDEFSDICDEHDDGADYDVTFGDGVLAFDVGDGGKCYRGRSTGVADLFMLAYAQY